MEQRIGKFYRYFLSSAEEFVQYQMHAMSSAFVVSHYSKNCYLLPDKNRFLTQRVITKYKESQRLQGVQGVTSTEEVSLGCYITDVG